MILYTNFLALNMYRRQNYEVWKIAGRWQHAKNASMVKMITIKNSLRLVTSIEVSRLTIWN